MKILWTSAKRKISDLNPAQYNPRQLSDNQKENLKKSLDKFCLVDPIIINLNNTIVGGHQRINILKTQNVDEVDVRIPSRLLTLDEEKELNLRLNKNLGEWDFDALANFDEEILKNIGFDSMELDKIFQIDSSEEDDIPTLRKETNIKRGDILCLGRHRVMCGDSTNADDVALLMDGGKADMVFTDPPYGVSYGRENEKLKKDKDISFHWSKTRINSRIQGDDKSAKELSETLWRPSFKNLYDFANDDCSFYLTMCRGGDQMMMMMMMMAENWQIKHEIIWVKSQPVFSMGRLDYDYRHEPILFGWKKKHNFYGQGQFKNSVWEISKPNKSDLHPTMKPIELIVNALLNSSKRGDICLDLFLGSGSTLIACEKTNRICYGMEIDPIYVQVIIDRWEKFTGGKSVKLNEFLVET